MTYSKEIKEVLSKYKEGEIFEANILYSKTFKHIPEYAFFKTLSRLVKNKELIRVSKGVYSVPKKSRFGQEFINEKQILNYYIGENVNNGLKVGYHLYNKYKLTTQVSKNTILFSNKLSQETKKIDNITIYKKKLNYSINTVKTIEFLEILQNYESIEDLNYKKLYDFIEENVFEFNEENLKRVLREIKYKKSTLASLENTLNYFKIENNVNQYLNKLSKYHSINMEELHELAST